MQIPPAPCPSPLVSSRVVSIPTRSLAEYPATSPAHKIPPWSQCLPALSPTAADLTHCLPTITAHQSLQATQDKLGQNFITMILKLTRFSEGVLLKSQILSKAIHLLLSQMFQDLSKFLSGAYVELPYSPSATLQRWGVLGAQVTNTITAHATKNRKQATDKKHSR